MTVEVPVGGEMLQPDLLAALHGFSSHTVTLIVRPLHRPVTVDVLLHHGARHGLLAGPRAVLDVVAVQPHLVVAVHQLEDTPARHGLGLGAGQAGTEHHHQAQ